MTLAPILIGFPRKLVKYHGELLRLRVADRAQALQYPPTIRVAVATARSRRAPTVSMVAFSPWATSCHHS
jgi:hypothetical protein